MRTAVLTLVSLTALAACGPAKYPRLSDGEYQAKADACIAGFPTDPTDPVRAYLNAGKHYQLEQVWGTDGSDANPRPGAPTETDIKWNASSTEPYTDNVARDTCASLYHELAHGAQNLAHENSTDVCAGTTIQWNEFEAVQKENKYRAGKGLPARTKYDHQTLPDTCTRTPVAKSGDKKHEDGCVECAGSDGDPHLVTFDRRAYSFQAVGEFVLVKGDGLEIQVRQRPWQDSTFVSVNTAVAVSVQGRRRTITAQDQVTWPDGSAVWITPIGTDGLRVQVKLAEERKGKVSGLLGDYDGDPDNDAADEVYGAFADQWRVKDSLFDYEPGKNTDSYTDRNFPSRETTPADVPNREQAEQTCRAAGVTQQPFLDFCVLDVGLTGKKDFATSAAAQQAALRKPVPPADTAQDLKFGAPLDLALTKAATDCATDADQFSALLLDSDLELSVLVNKGYRGPGEYALGSIISNSGLVTLTSRSKNYLGASLADAGKLTVAADGRSGTIDLEVRDETTTPVRITGSWACKEVKTG